MLNLLSSFHSGTFLSILAKIKQNILQLNHHRLNFNNPNSFNPLVRRFQVFFFTSRQQGLTSISKISTIDTLHHESQIL